MKKIDYTFSILLLFILSSCTQNLPNIGFRLIEVVPNEQFINNCKTPVNKLIAVNLDTQDIIDTGYVKDIAILQTAIRNTINSDMLLDTITNKFLQITCDTCTQALQMNKKNKSILVNLQKGNVFFMNKILIDLKIKYESIDFYSQEKILNWIVSLDSMEFGGVVYSEKHPNWYIINYQYQNIHNLHLLDSLYLSIHKCTDNCFNLPSKYSEINDKKPNYIEIKNSKKLDILQPIIIVYDAKLGTLRRKFFFKYRFCHDINGYLQLKKQLLNPEAMLYRCE